MSTETKSLATEIGHPSPRLRLALAAGALAALAAWAIGEAFAGRFGLPGRLIGKMGTDTEVMRLMAEAQAKRAMLATTALGGALGLAMGLAGAMSRRTVPARWWAAVLGMVAGGAAAFAATVAMVPWFDRFGVEVSDNLLVALLLHGAPAGAIGAASGLAYGFGLYGRRGLLLPLLGGLLGALLGVSVYQTIGAVALPASGTARPIAATTVARLLSVLSLALPAALGAAMAVQPATVAEAD